MLRPMDYLFVAPDDDTNGILPGLIFPVYLLWFLFLDSGSACKSRLRSSGSSVRWKGRSIHLEKKDKRE